MPNLWRFWKSELHWENAKWCHDRWPKRSVGKADDYANESKSQRGRRVHWCLLILIQKWRHRLALHRLWKGWDVHPLQGVLLKGWPRAGRAQSAAGERHLWFVWLWWSWRLWPRALLFRSQGVAAISAGDTGQIAWKGESRSREEVCRKLRRPERESPKSEELRRRSQRIRYD